MGCNNPLGQSNSILECAFAAKGFSLPTGRTRYKPCGSRYHAGCVKVGYPFFTRRTNQGGLSFPKVSVWPNFICEACTVRAVLKRELHNRNDTYLMCLERMRMLDMAHRWSAATHRQYQLKLRYLQAFGNRYGAHILQPTQLECPPSDASIPLAWALQECSLKDPIRTKSEENPGLKFQTLRALRSAASQFQAWDFMLAHPAACLTLDKGKLASLPVRSTDAFNMQLLAQGMASRLGTKAERSVPLLDQHVRFLDQELEQAYRAATTREEKLEIARAGGLNLLLWKGWLRSAESFNADESDFRWVVPSRGPMWDLPSGCGCIGLDLLPETKSSRSRRADVIMAWKTVSGLCLGLWLMRMVKLSPHWGKPNAKAFRSPDGHQWTSAYFRKKFLYPSLRRQQAAGDPYLAQFRDDVPGQSIEDKFWSLHSYRRGSRSAVSRANQSLRTRRATNDQVYEHARWERKHSASEAIDVIYREWQIIDRIQITLLCM